MPLIKAVVRRNILEAAEQILRQEGAPMHFSELTEYILRSHLLTPGEAAHLRQLNSILVAECKDPHTEFRMSGSGAYGLKEFGAISAKHSERLRTKDEPPAVVKQRELSELWDKWDKEKDAGTPASPSKNRSKEVSCPGFRRLDRPESTTFKRPRGLIKGTAEPLLASTVDYDMEGQDCEWLAAFNAARAEPLSEDAFERLIDRFEKATNWEAVPYALESLPSLHPSSDVQAAVYEYWLMRRKAVGGPLLPAFDFAGTLFKSRTRPTHPGPKPVRQPFRMMADEPHTCLLCSGNENSTVNFLLQCAGGCGCWFHAACHPMPKRVLGREEWQCCHCRPVTTAYCGPLQRRILDALESMPNRPSIVFRIRIPKTPAKPAQEAEAVAEPMVVVDTTTGESLGAAAAAAAGAVTVTKDDESEEADMGSESDAEAHAHQLAPSLSGSTPSSPTREEAPAAVVAEAPAVELARMETTSALSVDTSGARKRRHEDAEEDAPAAKRGAPAATPDLPGVVRQQTPECANDADTASIASCGRTSSSPPNSAHGSPTLLLSPRSLSMTSPSTPVAASTALLSPTWNTAKYVQSLGGRPLLSPFGQSLGSQPVVQERYVVRLPTDMSAEEEDDDEVMLL